jgi:hypothetical protein
MDLYEIIKKLTGPISSVGETNADHDRFKGLVATIELVDRLVFDISDAALSKNYPEASRAKIGKRAQEFIADLRDSLNEENTEGLASTAGSDNPKP